MLSAWRLCWVNTDQNGGPHRHVIDCLIVVAGIDQNVNGAGGGGCHTCPAMRHRHDAAPQTAVAVDMRGHLADIFWDVDPLSLQLA